ncbi:dGTPase [Stutzerimonas urumqiensis]|uniref:dGTPase n=1 Tax=Stutzerimonas urumqiensis TaxID=638269 RepID=UPI003DA261A0
MRRALDYGTRISRARPRGGPSERLLATQCSLDELLHELESDRGRIINSAAVRRLQQKTQVFPLERNAAVRSRLTHSLEVQQTGRYIVRTLYKALGDRARDYGLAGLEPAFETLVEMACLTHDIGNPPFGHFGEYALGDWFAQRVRSLFAAAVPVEAGDAALRERMLADLSAFEGNAQAVRLVVKLLRLNLTYTQTAGLLKYVRPAAEPRPDKTALGAYLNKKPGFYLSEAPFIEGLRASLGMAAGTRHPIVYVMEAADDIAYCLADIEDSVEKGILDIETVAHLLTARFTELAPADEPVPGTGRRFAELVEGALVRARAEEINRIGEFFIGLRVRMIHPLVHHAAEQFIAHIEPIYDGTFDRALMEDDSVPHAIVQTFKDVAMDKVFCHREVETLQLQGFRIIQGLLDFYAPLLGVPAPVFDGLIDGRGRTHPHLQMLMRRLPSHLIQAYREAVRQQAAGGDAPLWEFYHRCRLLQDLVSGMTDQHAQDEFRTLSAT